MTTRIAILHGGPADRTQTVVVSFTPTIYFAINEPVYMRPLEPGKTVDCVDVHQARYEQVMAPVNPGRDTMRWYGPKYTPRGIPDQEVCLYVYVGDKA